MKTFTLRKYFWFHSYLAFKYFNKNKSVKVLKIVNCDFISVSLAAVTVTSKITVKMSFYVT